MINPRLIYTCALWLLLPYVFFHLLWRARRQPEYLQHIPERFGFYSTRLPHLNPPPKGEDANASLRELLNTKPVIWLHTVSVGETRAAASLIQRLSASYPDHRLLLTHTTPTGRATSAQLYGDKLMRVYLPYDYPWAVKRFLRHFRPQVGILLETEIWFNLIHHCKLEHIPLLLLNARLSERSALSYARFSKLSRQGLSELGAIAAQTEDDARRLRELGGRDITVMGNLKFDIDPPSAMLERGQQLRVLFGTARKIFLAASTREGEEELILAALAKIEIDNLLAIIVPRHPQRFDEVAALIERAGCKYQKRSDNAAIRADTSVVLGDSMGEMFAYYAACDVALIGGSLLPFGGQNLIEACTVGKPVLIGPHTFNFAQASQLAVSGGAALRIADTAALADALQSLFSDPDKMREMGTAGLLFVRSNQGATERALLQIDRALAQRST